MSKKSKIFLTMINAFGIIAIVLCVLGGIILDGVVDDNGNQMFPVLSDVLGLIGICMIGVLFIYAIIQRAYINNQCKLIKNVIVPYIKEKKYDELISYLNYQIDKRFIASIVMMCKINLVSAYLLKSDNNKAKELLLNIKWGLFIKHTYYYKMVIYLFEDNIALAKNEYNSLKCLKRPIKAQLEMANKIITMVDTKKYNEEIENNTTLPIVKEICNRYK